jgi:hypothetical protein
MAPSPNRIITLTTDFGIQDSFVGSMKGVIYQIDPTLICVDITHTVPPQNIIKCGRVLAEACPYFPAGTTHLAVVDPGVGSGRHAVAIETETAFFIGPDNGLFTTILETHKTASCHYITNSAFFREKVSNTFHGRDIFAPVAALIASGKAKISELGEITRDPVRLTLDKPEKMKSGISGKIVDSDRFGNLITNIHIEDLPELVAKRHYPMRVQIGAHFIEDFVQNYAAGPPGKPVALIGSSNFLEIAIPSGSAITVLEIKEGDDVHVRWPSSAEKK